MFSDAYKIKLVDDVLYEVYGKVRHVLVFFMKSRMCGNLMSNRFLVSHS